MSLRQKNSRQGTKRRTATCGGTLNAIAGIRRKPRLGPMTYFAAASTLLIFSPDLPAEPPPRTLDQALSATLALGNSSGCGSAFGIVQQDGTPDNELIRLSSQGQLGRELAAVCGSSAVSSAAALGGSMGSVQTTKTVSQFRLARRRVDSRLDLKGRRFGFDGPIQLAALDGAVFSPFGDDVGLNAATRTGPGVFAEGDYERRRRQTTALEQGYLANTSNMLLGVDYVTENALVFGAWAGYKKSDADYAGSTLTVGGLNTDESAALPQELNDRLRAEICRIGPGGDFEDAGGRFGGFVGARSGNGFADLTVQYSRRTYDYRRNICAIEVPGVAGPIVRDPDSPSGFSKGGLSKGAGLVIEDVYSGTISGRTKLTEWGVSARAGYDFGDESFLLGPRISVHYVRSKLAPFTENGRSTVDNTVTARTLVLQTTRAIGAPTGLELAFAGQSRTSLQTELQLVAAFRFDTRFGAMIPRLSGSWIHDFRAERRLVTVRMAQDRRPNPTLISFTTDSSDKNKGVIAIGVSAVLGPSVTADLEVSRLVGDDRFDATAVAAQARWRF
jgi:hypothetical protein